MEKWWELDEDPPPPGPIQPIDPVAAVPAPGTIQAVPALPSPGPIQPLDPVVEPTNFTPVPAGFFDLPADTGFGASAVAPLGLDNSLPVIEPSLGFTNTAPASDTLSVDTTPIDAPPGTTIGPEPTTANLFGVDVPIPQFGTPDLPLESGAFQPELLPAFQAVADRAEDRRKNTGVGGDFESLTNPFPKIWKGLGDAYQGEVDRAQYAIDNELSMFNIWVAGVDAPTREDAGVNAPGFGGATAGPVGETLGQVRRNLMRVPAVGDGMRYLGDTLALTGDLITATTSDLPFKTRLPDMGTGKRGPSIGRVARDVVANAVEPTQGMFDSPQSFLNAMIAINDRGANLPAFAKGNPVGTLGVLTLDAAARQIAVDAAISDELGFDVAAPADELTDEQLTARGYGELNAFSPDAVPATIRDIYTQDERIDALNARATEKMAQSEAATDDETARKLAAEAALLGDEAYKESLKGPLDYVDARQSIWDEIIFGSLFDISPFATQMFGRMGLDPISRRISRAGRDTVDFVDQAEWVERIAKATTSDADLLNAVGKHNYLKDIASLGFNLKDTTKASRSMYAVHQGFTAVGSMIESTADMRKVVRRWLDDPEKLVDGFDDLDSPGLLLRTTDEGKAYFGIGALGSEAMLEARKSLLAVRSEVDELVSMLGDGKLNHRVFYDELRELAYKGELKRAGSLKHDLPIGVGFVEAGVDEDGAAVVRYYNQKAKKDRVVIRESQEFRSLGAAERVAKDANKMVGGMRQAQANLNLGAAVANVQRTLMSGLVLNLSPRALVRHVISNTAQLQADGIYKVERLTDQLEWVAKKYDQNDALSARQVDALADDINQSVRVAYEFSSPRLNSAIDRLPWQRKLKDLRSGLSNVAGFAVGEEAFAMTASVQGARRFIQKYTPQVSNEFGRVLRDMGKNDAFVRNAEARLLSAMVEGGSNDLAKTFRDIVNNGTMGFSLNEYGPYMDVLGIGGVDELESLMKRAYGRNKEEVIADVRAIFDKRTASAQVTLAQTGIEPGQNVFEGMDGLWDVAEITRDTRYAYKKAGFSEAQAEAKVRELTDRLGQVHEQGRNNLANAVMDRNDPRGMGYMLDTWKQIRESEALRNEAQATAAKRAIDIAEEFGSGDRVRAGWETYAREADEIYGADFARREQIYDNAMQALANGELPPYIDVWEEVAAATALDDNVLRASLRVDLGSAVGDSDVYGQIIEAGRLYVRRSQARAYWMGREVLERDNSLNTAVMNALASASRDEEHIAKLTRGRILESQKKLLPKDAPAYYAERDRIQREGFRAARERWEAGAKEIGLYERQLQRGVRNPLEFNENLIDDDLDAMLFDRVGQIEEARMEELRQEFEIDQFLRDRVAAAPVDGVFDDVVENAEGLPILDGPIDFKPQSLPDDMGRGERVYTAADAARNEIRGLQDAQRAMDVEWDSAMASYPGGVGGFAPIPLRTALNAFLKNNIPDSERWRNMVDALTGNSDFAEFENWLGRYQDLKFEIQDRRAIVRDSERFTGRNRARLSRDEIAEDPSVQRTLGQAGFPIEDVQLGSRRDLLNVLEDALGKEGGDFETYFYSGLPLGPIMETVFNIEDGEGLINRVWKNNRKRAAMGNVNNRLDMGTVAKARIDAAADAERSISQDVDRWIYGGNEQYQERFTPAERNALVQWQSEVLAPKFDDILAGASQAGEAVSSFGMVDFANGARHIDDWIGMLVPYHFWYTRAFKNFAERAMTQPGYVSRMSNYYQAVNNYGEQEDLPTRNRGKLPIPFLTIGGDRVLMPDPIQSLMPPALTSFQFNDYANPDEGKTSLERIMRTADMVGVGAFPWTRAAVEGAAGREDIFAGEIIPPYQDLGWLVKGMTGITLPGSLPDYEPYFPARQARNAVLEGELSEFDGKMVMDMARRQMTGEPLLPEQVGGGYEDLYKEYSRRAGWEKFVPRLLSHMTGFSAATQPEEELRVRAATQAYNNAGFDPVTNPYGSRAGSQYLLQNGDPNGDLPFEKVDAQFSLNSVTRDQESMRPGVAAVSERAYARGDEIQDALGALATAASEAVILAHPQQKPKRGDEIDAQKQAILAGADQYLSPAEILDLDTNSSPFGLITSIKDAVNERENPSAEKFSSTREKRNPREKAEDSLVKLLRAEQVGKAPTYPGEGASDEALSTYYSANDAFFKSKLNYVERIGGRIVSEDDGPTPSPDDLLLTELLQGEYAAELLRDYKNRFATAIQENYYNSLELDQAYRDQVEGQRFVDIRARFGADAVAKFEAYRKLPKSSADGLSPERKAYRDANPEMASINLFAYTPDDYEYALQTFGSDIFDLLASYPQGDQSGEGLKAWNNKYNQSTKDEVYELFDWNRDWTAQFEAQAKAQYGEDIIDLAKEYPSTNKGYTKAQRDAWRNANPSAYARLGDFWDYRSAQYTSRDAQRLAAFGKTIVDAAAARPGGQGDPRKAAWREANGADAQGRLNSYWDWYGARVYEETELVAPEMGTPEAVELLRYGRQPISSATAGSVSDLVQYAPDEAVPSTNLGGQTPGKIAAGDPPAADQTVQAVQSKASGTVTPGTVTTEGAGDINQRMQPFWDRYKALGTSAEKAKFLNDNPEFAAFYQTSLGLSDDQRWWLESNRRSGGGNSFTQRSFSGGGGGRGGSVAAQSSPYFASLASVARDVPRFGRSSLWVDTPWPIFRNNR